MHFAGLIAYQEAPGADPQVEQLQPTETDIIPMSGNGLFLLQQIQHQIEPNSIESDVIELGQSNVLESGQSDVLEMGQLQHDVKAHKVGNQVKVARFRLGK